MALIKDFERKDPTRESVHSEVECDYYTFEKDGEKYIQFSTYGSNARQIQGKQSQVFQLDRKSAQKLISVLQDSFK